METGDRPAAARNGADRADFPLPLDREEVPGVALIYRIAVGASLEEELDPTKKTKKEPREYSAPAVDRTLDILEFMAENHRPYGATDLSRALNIPLNSTFRILKRLTEREYTAHDPVSGGYQLGTRVFSLGMSLYTRYELRRIARSHLERLCRETEETCQIQVPKNDRLLVLDTISPEVEFYLSVVPGSLVYYHPSAFGKAILAFMEEARVREIIPESLLRFTPSTVTRRDDLLAQFESIRKTGLAYDDEEYTMGIRCIGAPVFDVAGNVVAGLGITGLVSTFLQDRKGKFERLVLRSAANVSRDIGYSGAFFDDKV